VSVRAYAFVMWLLMLDLMAAPENLIVNPEFRDGLRGWRVAKPAGVKVIGSSRDGAPAAEIAVSTEAEVGFPNLQQEFPAVEGEFFVAEATGMAGDDIRGGHGLYMALEFVGTDGQRISSTGATPMARGEWLTRKVFAEAPKGTEKVKILLLLNGVGAGYWRSAALYRHKEPPSPYPGPIAETVTLTIIDEPVNSGLIGLGFEDDGYFYNQVNRDGGVDDDAIALREKRIREMKPDFVRMFFNIKDWCPKGDWRNFTFDSGNMQSRYRALKLYQSIGAHVNFVNVHWGLKDAYRDAAGFVKANADLLELLIRKKGFTCIKYWTHMNEPNYVCLKKDTTDPLQMFAEIQRLMYDEIKRRKLDVQIMGSDDGNNLEWFKLCVKHNGYFERSGAFASHKYFDKYAFYEEMEKELQPRLDLLRRKAARGAGVKPFIMAEFGFRDSRTAGACSSPIMREPDHALMTAAFATTGLNMGVSGFSIWTVAQMRYLRPKFFMEYGLWGYKEDNWEPFPVYYVWRVLCRETRRGDPVYGIENSHPQPVKAARVRDTVFLVNLTTGPVKLRFKGKSPDSFMTLQPFVSNEYKRTVVGGSAQLRPPSVRPDASDSGLEGEAAPSRVRGRVLTLPPRSFSYGRLGQGDMRRMVAAASGKAIKPLERIAVRKGEPHAQFVLKDSGKPFFVKGFNYIRLRAAEGKTGGDHATFDADTQTTKANYDPKRAEAMFTVLSRAGYNTVRVFIIGRSPVNPGIAGDYGTTKALHEPYMQNVLDFLHRAARHGIRVFPAFGDGGVPRNAYYREGLKGKGHNKNVLILTKDGIDARIEHITSFLEYIKKKDPGLLPTLLGVQCQNEAYLRANHWPFTEKTGTFTAANGKTYDLSRTDERQALMDEGYHHYHERVVVAVKAIDPEMLVSEGLFVLRAVGKDAKRHAGVWPGKTRDERYPPMLTTLGEGVLDFLDVHFYRSNGREPVEKAFRLNLGSTGFFTPKMAEIRKTKPVIVGEFGAFDFVEKTFEEAVGNMIRVRDLALKEKVNGMLFWTYDCFEQPRLHHAATDWRLFVREMGDFSAR